jgi:hypothetical protein
MLGNLNENLKSGKFDRIIITGMGSSLNAAYPAVIRLCSQSIPVSISMPRTIALKVKDLKWQGARDRLKMICHDLGQEKLIIRISRWRSI